MAKKMDCQEEQPEAITPKPEVPQTKAYLLKRLNELEKAICESRFQEERLAKEIRKLEEQRRMYCGPLAKDLEEKNFLLKLYKEVGGNEWEVTG